MSLPWRKSVRLRVVPGSVCGTLEQGLLRCRLLASANHASDGPELLPGDAAEQPPDRPDDGLAQALDAVLLELAQTTSLQGARLDVELADALVHLDVVAGDFAGDSDRQLQSVAFACVAELLGDAAQHHEIRWQLQADGKHLLIVAMARDQVRTLTDAAARHGLTLRSVQPDFCVQWNRHSARLQPGAAVFAVASGHEAVIACVSRGAIAALSSGAWLDRQDAFTSQHVTRLLCGLGLQPSATAGMLDSRVDCLLASAGLEAANQAAYVLVAPKLSDNAVSSRWTIVNREVQAR